MTTKEYYIRNKEKIREYQKKYRANSDVWRKSNRHWKENNPGKMKSYLAKYYASPKGKLTKLRLRATRDNIHFDMKLDDVINWLTQQNGKCHYCGAKLNTNKGHKMLDGDSIDRRDNKKGYVIDNIVSSCNRCNMIKGSWFTEEQMTEIAQKYFIR